MCLYMSGSVFVHIHVLCKYLQARQGKIRRQEGSRECFGLSLSKSLPEVLMYGEGAEFHV